MESRRGWPRPNGTRSILPVIRKVQASEARSLAEIADALNARGVLTARGGSWSPMTVKRVLDRTGQQSAARGRC